MPQQSPVWPKGRCAHSMVKSGGPGEVLLYGGRHPLGIADSWTSLEDLWVYNLPNQHWAQQARAVPQRSDMSSVVWQGGLYVMGGLFTQTASTLSDNNIYIMKDFFRVDLASNKTIELQKGPSWRFGHTSVLHNNKVILYGGGGGRHILSDIWRYDLDDGDWIEVNPTVEEQNDLAWELQNLMFGTLGFSIYTCVIICIFVRRTHHQRLVQMRRGSASVPIQPAESRAATEDMLDKLEVAVYSEGMDMGPQDTCCSVCLVDYTEGEELRVMPCKHFFHKACVDRWLKHDATCPHCRYNLSSQSNPPPLAQTPSLTTSLPSQPDDSAAATGDLEEGRGLAVEDATATGNEDVGDSTEGVELQTLSSDTPSEEAANSQV